MDSEYRKKTAQKRLVSILEQHGISNARTLEQKISDAGPNNQRIDPHILTTVRRKLIEEGKIKVLWQHGAPWFYLPSTPEQTVQKRLAEQLPIFLGFQHGDTGKRVGQCLEIAIYRALLQQDTLEHIGGFTNLEEHDDSSLYSKEEPPQSLSGKHLPGKTRLDFLVWHQGSRWAGIEAKNIREWIYPNRKEIIRLLEKAVALDCVPVLIARRISFVAFKVLSTCGVVLHETYNQLLPEADRDLAEKARDKRLLGYHDVRVGNQPGDRLVKFVSSNLPQVLPEARIRFDEYKDLVRGFVDEDISYKEFAARVRRRSQGTSEDNDWE